MPTLDYVFLPPRPIGLKPVKDFRICVGSQDMAHTLVAQILNRIKQLADLNNVVVEEEERQQLPETGAALTVYVVRGHEDDLRDFAWDYTNGNIAQCYAALYNLPLPHQA